MITLNDLTTTELEYLRSKWRSEQTELNNEKSRKQKRLDDRLDRQAADGTAQTVLETNLAHAQAVLDQLTSSGAAPALITEQQAIVDGLQADIDNFSSSASYLSNPDAILAQLDLDEIDQAVTLRITKIAEVDALLGV